MDIVARAKSLIVKPAQTWPEIEREASDWQQLYVPYMVVLAAIPAVAGFIGWSILRVGGGVGASTRDPLVTGLAMMISQYLITLVMVGAWGWLINLLAGTFGGQPRLMNALKLSVYASTPAMLAGVFSAIPALAVLSILGGLYSLYVLYLGLPVLMKNPPEKSVPYIVVVAVVGIIASALISAFGAALMPRPLSPLHGSGDIERTAPAGDIQKLARCVDLVVVARNA